MALAHVPVAPDCPSTIVLRSGSPEAAGTPVPSTPATSGWIRQAGDAQQEVAAHAGTLATVKAHSLQRERRCEWATQGRQTRRRWDDHEAEFKRGCRYRRGAARVGDHCRVGAGGKANQLRDLVCLSPERQGDARRALSVRGAAGSGSQHVDAAQPADERKDGGEGDYEARRLGGSEPQIVFDKTESEYYLAEVHIPGIDGFDIRHAPGEHSHTRVPARP